MSAHDSPLPCQERESGHADDGGRGHRPGLTGCVGEGRLPSQYEVPVNEPPFIATSRGWARSLVKGTSRLPPEDW